MKRNVDYDRKACLFCLTKNKKLEINSLICNLYFCQRIGFDLSFTFRGVSRFVQSHKAVDYIDSCVYNGNLVFCDEQDTYTYTDDGNYSEVPIAYTDMKVIDKLSELLEDLTQTELCFLVTLDILNISLVSDKELYSLSFSEKRDYVTSTLKRLYSIYTDDVFEGACNRLKNVLDLSELLGKYDE